MDDIRIDRIVRSRRRTIALIVTPEAEVIVRAPRAATSVMIDAFVRKQRRWIHTKIAEMKARPRAADYTYAEGEVFWFLGRPYPLQIVDDGRTVIERTDHLCVSRALQPGIRTAIKHWYMTEAEKEIHSRCMWFSMMTGYSPASVRITDARQRWGSCTSMGGLNFSWRLIQAPLGIVDYVIVHELVHLRQPDHSRKFWEKVEALMPNYRQRRDWLRANERLLRI